ncbi:hypothetical protein KFL_000530110 [Klebsormidium nitens]|uniref:Glutaredoxin-like protein n=1 Tax=Klebsormidium nitens TaxID=105231 RepID=A0A1Y1HQM5_KLENI|nr:hypothetical protein KFL_000530110 [Klebsormidium nitens]|eukprot:GAQ80383.1 hypothetical protein KFL_000530110 [Klebsormidium nitens]
MAFMMGGEHSIAGMELEIRNILDKKEWEQAYQYEIPVLTWSNEGSDDEVAIPRFSPRTSIERMQKQLHSLLTS